MPFSAVASDILAVSWRKPTTLQLVQKWMRRIACIQPLARAAGISLGPGERLLLGRLDLRGDRFTQPALGFTIQHSAYFQLATKLRKWIGCFGRRMLLDGAVCVVILR